MQCKFLTTMATIFVLFSSNGSMAAESNKVLVLFFSHSGNTRSLAEMIHHQVGGDLVEIKTTLPYPQDYDTVVDQAKREQQQNFRPQLATQNNDLSTFSTIFIGYPNWWGTMPMALFTFFESHNLSGKKLIPFCTHEGSSLGRSIADMQKLAPGATILEGLAIRGRSVRDTSARTDIADWLAKLQVPMAKQ
jgi:flavodoxin